jgi:hypothetical protein
VRGNEPKKIAKLQSHNLLKNYNVQTARVEGRSCEEGLKQAGH